MRRIFVLFISFFTFMGCEARYNDFFPYHDNGVQKPHVAFLPTVVAPNVRLPWNIQQELTHHILLQLKRHGRIYAIPTSKAIQLMGTVPFQTLWTSKNQAEFLKCVSMQFVVVTEISEFAVQPYVRGAIKPIYPANLDPRDAEVLTIKVRLKIVDMKEKEPKVVRQEVFQSNHMVPKGILEKEVQYINSTEFNSTSLGKAVTRLYRDLGERIEETVTWKKPI